MRILIAADLYWPTTNGVATFSRNLAKGLSVRGHEVVVIAPSQTGKKSIEHDGKVRVARTSSLPFPFYQNFRVSISPQREVKRIMKSFQPDIVHIQSIFGVGYASMGCANKMDIPVVATNHAMPENLLDNMRLLAPFAKQISTMLESYGARFLSNAQYVTTPTQAAIDMFDDKKHLIQVPFKPISNGIDLSRFCPGDVPDEVYKKYRIPKNVPVITYVGRLDSEKHLPVLVKAVARVLKQHQAHLVIVGHGNEGESLKDLAYHLKMSKHMTLTGRVTDDMLEALHRIGTIFAIPSPAELQSIATLEAMASGKPIVAVNAGALHELCHDGENGYLFELDDDEQMAEGILKLLDDKKLQGKMAKKSMAIAKTHDLQHTLDQFEKIYRDLA